MPDQTPDPADFLGRCDVIDWDDRGVKALAEQLAGSAESDTAVARRCFRWVRDEVRHSSDYQLNPVTCSASQVLAHRTGYCYAKSHLLCALLRANDIPAGLCYQRLRVDEAGARFCLHGIAAVFLRDFGWYRVDPRGNREGIDADFTPPTERLAFTTDLPGEADLEETHRVPLEPVYRALRQYKTWDTLYDHLPDVE